jgi:hypothetical protein
MIKGQQSILQARDDNGKTRWVRVGTAFPLKNAPGFTLCLDAIPTGLWDGKLVMKPEKVWPQKGQPVPSSPFSDRVYGARELVERDEEPPFPDEFVPDAEEP